jgi:hypothetical protein
MAMTAAVMAESLLKIATPSTKLFVDLQAVDREFLLRKRCEKGVGDK